MKHIFKTIFTIAIAAFITGMASAQVATNSGSGLSATYPSLAAAVTALNAATITSPVVITLTGNETAPVGGYTITATGTAANTITIEGSASTITANTGLTPGALNDAIFKLVGADYVTIKNFTMQENAANTTTVAGTNNMTEWGVALLYATATNGAQFDSISGNTISLNRTYQNTFGIYANATHTATAVTASATATTTAGGNTGLIITSNNISNVNMGIVIVGPTAAADNNDAVIIGGLGKGNTITNFGTTGTFSSYVNVSGSVNGIIVRNTKNFEVSYNTVTSSVGGTTGGTLRGIFIPSFTNAPTGTIVNKINNNTISLQSAVAAGTINGIENQATTGNATTTLNINNNDFNTFGHTVAASGTITFITNAMIVLTSNINNNTFTNITCNTTGTVTFVSQAYNLFSGSAMNINGNSIVTAFSKTGAGNAVVFYSSNASSVNGSTTSISNNNLSNITLTGATGFTGISNTDGATTVSGPVKIIDGNTISNLTGGTGTMSLMVVNFSGANSSVSNNTISNVNWGSAITVLNTGSSNQATLSVNNNNIFNIASTGGIVVGLSSGAPTVNISSNKIYALSASSSSAVSGMQITAGTLVNVYKNKIYDISGSNAGTSANGILVSTTPPTTLNIYNNYIGDLRAPIGSGADIIRGLSFTAVASGTSFNVYYNTIYMNASSSAANFGTTGIYHTTSGTSTFGKLDLRNNIIVNNSTPSGSALCVALRRSTTSLVNYANTSDRNDLVASKIFTDGTNTDVTLADYKARVAGIPADVNSVSEAPNFLSTAGGNANFLHIDPTIASVIESGAANIATYTDDYDANVRQGNGGYTGTGTAPDIGADEFETAIVGCSSADAGTIPATQTKCAGQTVSISATGATTGTGITYQWKVATVSGGPYVNVTGGTGATTTSYTSAALTAGTFYYVLETTCVNGPIVDLSNEDTVIVNATPVTVVNPSSGTYCTPGGSAVSLTASGAASFSWSPATGLSAATGATVTASPSATTTYTVTGTTAGCSSTATAAITVSESPSISSVSAAPASTCSGSNSVLTAVAGTTAAYTVQSAAFVNETPSGTPTTIFTTGADDAMSASIAIPFSFQFFGQTYANLFASPNGFVQLGTNSNNTTDYGSAMPTAATPNNIIAGVWDDLIYTNASATARYFTNGIAPNRIFVIEYSNVQFYNSNAKNGSANFQIKLFETSNKVEIHLVGVTDPVPSNHFAGIENATGTIASVPAGRNPYSANITTSEAWAFIPSGGTVTYTWSPATFLSGTTGASVTATAMTSTTTYTVTAEVAGCSATSSPLTVTVIDISAPVTAVNVTCNGAANGTFSLGTVGCGTAPFTYSLDGGVTYGAIPTNLTPGTYSVVVKDNTGLTAAPQSITITEPAAVPVPVSSGNKTVCANTSSVYVKANSMKTVVIPFNISAQPAETNAAPGNIIASANLPANLGTVTNAVLTYNGITAIGASWQSDVRLGLSGSVVDAAAAGTGAPNSNGTFNYTRVIANSAVSLSGGTVNLLYWDSTNDLVGSADATFTTGASAATLTITYNPAPTISWYDAAVGGNLLGSGDSIQAVGTTLLPNTSTPGIYKFYAQANFGGCPSPSRDSVKVTVNALPMVSYTATPNDTVCAGTQMTLAGTGAVSYTWNNGITNNTAFTPTTQTYTVTGIGANGCVNTANAPVKVNTLPTVTANVSPNDSVCAGTQVTLNGGGAASYTWDNSVINNTAFTPSTGTYTVTGTDVNGCTKTASIALVVSTGLTASATNTSISCNGGNSTVTVSATGGVSPYTGTGTFSVTAGTYSYTVTDAVGCTSVANVTIGEPSALSVSSSVTAPIACNGDTGAVTVVATGGTSPYTGTGVQTVYSGAYTFTVTDASGCSATTTGNVSEPAALVASYTSTAISCNGGNSSVTVSATGGTSPYTGIGTAAIPAGTYNDYIVTDDNGCTDTIDIVIAEPAAVVVSITSTPIACNGGSSTIVVSATGGTGSYTGDGTFTETAGTYNYTVTDANSCTGTASVTISEPTAFTVSTSTTAILCNGGTSTITVTGNGGTSPYTGEVTETQPDGTYNYSLTDANGCAASTSVTVTEPTALSATSSVTTPIACNGGNGTVTVVATGGTSPYTGDGAQTVSAGTYNLTVTDANGCSTSTTGTISEPTSLVASATTTAILCNGGTSTVVVSATGGTAPYSGEGSFTANAGSYSYTITDDNGCTSDATGTISEPAVLNADITTSTIICYGDSATVIVTASGGTSPYTGEVTEMQAAGTYNYTVTDDNGCSASNSVTITEPAENIVNQSVTICPGGMVMVGSSMYMTAGTYADTLTGNAGCDSIVNTTVIVNSAVTTTVTVNNETITSDEVGATYQWIDCNNNNAIISGETNQAFTATTNGSYAVIVTANGCASDTSDCTTILTVGIKTTSQNLFSVYPNPNNGEFTISTNVAGVYNIVNELGQSIQTLNLNNSNDLKVNLNLSNGVYYVVGYNESNIVKQKIVVLK